MMKETEDRLCSFEEKSNYDISDRQMEKTYSNALTIFLLKEIKWEKYKIYLL